jgi:hypothetical protein
VIEVRAARNKYAYFAHELHAAMVGLGTRDDDLIRLLVSKAEVGFEVFCRWSFSRLFN